MTSEPRRTDPSTDVLRPSWRHPLDVFFKPGSVAVIGATEREGSVGRTVLLNLVSSPFGGTVFPVSRTRSHVLGIKSYGSVREVPEPIDLALVVTPAPTVPSVLRECAAAGVGPVAQSMGCGSTW